MHIPFIWLRPFKNIFCFNQANNNRCALTFNFQPHSLKEKHMFSFGFYNKILVANDICD